MLRLSPLLIGRPMALVVRLADVSRGTDFPRTEGVMSDQEDRDGQAVETRRTTSSTGRSRPRARSDRTCAGRATRSQSRVAAPLAAGDRGGQPEGWRRQDDDDRQPRGCPGRSRLPSADHRSRSSGQRHHRARDRGPELRLLHVRRPAPRRAARGLRRADEHQEPVPGAGDDRSGRSRDRARSRLQPGASAEADAGSDPG